VLPLLAQLALPGASAPTSWYTIVFAVGCIASLVINVATLFATRREVEGLERRLQETRLELSESRREVMEMERRLNMASEQRAKDTHDRINEVLREVSALGGRFDQSQHGPHHHA
jgi:chromosome segregation ATPase